MGGMMAAGVLAKFFASVLVLDKDSLPASPEVRRGVPQGAHLHGLMVLGRENLEKIFPGFISDLIDRGAVVSRWGRDLRFCDGLGWHPKRDLELDFIGLSRPLLEHTVRAHLSRLGRVTIRDGTTVTGWRQLADKITVTLVQSGAEQLLDADFVVDATGRAGTALDMLRTNGYGPVEEITIDIGMSYSTALFEKPAGYSDPLHGCNIKGIPPFSQEGSLFSIEDNLWILSLFGRFDEVPPKDPPGFMAFVKNLPDPAIFERVSQAKQLGVIKTYRPAHSKWRRYDKLARFPDRLLPLGDAITQFNPLFAQGMSAASAHAMCLWELLAETAQSGGALEGIGREYLQKTRVVSEEVWRGLEPMEFLFAKVSGERPADIEQRIAFMQGLRKLMEEDAEVHRLMMRVISLVEPGSALMRDDIVARVNAINAAA